MVGFYRTEDRRQETGDAASKAGEIAALEAGKVQKEQGGTAADAMCPKCFRPVAAKIFDEPDRYGRKIRKYLGFCEKCNAGCEVIQFLREGRWLIHRYQLYPYAGAMCYGTGVWFQLNEMPEPAPIVIGPGGEFDKQVWPLLSKLRTSLEGVCQTIECLMKHKGMK